MFYQKSGLDVYETIHQPHRGILRPHVDSHSMQAYWLGTWYHTDNVDGINPNLVLPWTLPNSVLVLLLSINSGASIPSSLSFNSESYTRVANATAFGGAAETAHYYRVNPTPGAGQITTLTNGNTYEFWLTAYLLSGVNQTTPVADFGITINDTSSPASVTLSSSVKGIVTYTGSGYRGGEIDPMFGDGISPKTQGIYHLAQPADENLLADPQGWKRVDGANAQVTWTYVSTSGACGSVVSWSPA